MDIGSISNLNSVKLVEAFNDNLRSITSPENVDHSGFDSLLSAALNNIGTTNQLMADSREAQIQWALGESASTHDLTNALQKASTSLQYTIAVRDKFMEAYKEIMQMQI